MRVEAQDKVFALMNLYRTVKQRVDEQQIQLRKYMGSDSGSEVFELFQKAQQFSGDIPPEFDVACSCFIVLVPDLILLEKTRVQLDTLQSEKILEQIDIALKTIQNNGGKLSEVDWHKINTLFKRLIDGRVPDDAVGTDFYEQRAIRRFVDNWEQDHH